MVWKHLKKPAILVASLALAVGIAPMVAFADEVVPEGADGGDMVAQALTEIDSVSVTISQPNAGATTATAPTITTPNNSGYSAGDSFWSKDRAGTVYDSPAQFAEGETYYVHFNLTANDGYALSGNPVVTVTNGELVYSDGTYEGVLSALASVKAVAAAATPEEETDKPAADEPAADEPESTEPAATEPTPAVTDAETTTTETAANTDAAATTTTSNTTASTLPKTSDALPVALFGGIALMSGLVLAMAWRLRRN